MSFQVSPVREGAIFGRSHLYIGAVASSREGIPPTVTTPIPGQSRIRKVLFDDGVLCWIFVVVSIMGGNSDERKNTSEDDGKGYQDGKEQNVQLASKELTET